jgi:hypothetical protein
VELSLLPSIITKMAKHSIGLSATIVARVEKEKGHFGPYMGTRKNQLAKNVILHPSMLNSLMYFI